MYINGFSEAPQPRQGLKKLSRNSKLKRMALALHGVVLATGL